MKRNHITLYTKKHINSTVWYIYTQICWTLIRLGWLILKLSVFRHRCSFTWMDLYKKFTDRTFFSETVIARAHGRSEFVEKSEECNISMTGVFAKLKSWKTISGEQQFFAGRSMGDIFGKRVNLLSKNLLSKCVVLNLIFFCNNFVFVFFWKYCFPHA